MSEITRRINSFFKTALKHEVESIESKIILSERQESIFRMYYIRKYSIVKISDQLCVCPMVINNELKIIRSKIARII